MKKTLTLTLVLTFGLSFTFAQDVPSLQVAPSDQVKYPDASEILNKTDTTKAAKATAAASATPTNTALPTTKPLLATAPVAASSAAPVAARPISDHGWFVRWTITGDEESALGWVQALDLPASLHRRSDGLWEVWAGPLEATALGKALKGQGGVAELVRR